MTFLQGKVEKAIELFQASTKDVVPQLTVFYEQGLDEVLREGNQSGMEYIGRAYIAYLRVFKCIANLKPEEIEKVAKVEELIAEDEGNRARANQKQVEKGSASKITAVEALRMLGKEQREELYQLTLSGADVSSPIFAGALTECVSRLIKGSDLKAAGKIPSDSDPTWDDAYFGHTLITSPKAMINFVMSHYLTRTFEAKYKKDPKFGTLAFDKDALHDVLSVGMRIMIARGQFPKELAEVWIKRRSEGGLEWHGDPYDPNSTVDPKQKFYDAVFGPESAV